MLLDRDLILDLFFEVAEVLGSEGPVYEVIVAGGASLLFLGVRDSTRDVDSLVFIDGDLEEAVRLVGARHGLPPRWLNSSSSGWWPSTLEKGDCEVVFEEERLRVLAAPADVVFVMKMEAGRRERDLEDLDLLWPFTSFGSPEAAVAAHRKAYPEAVEDPHLVNWLRSVVGG